MIYLRSKRIQLTIILVVLLVGVFQNCGTMASHHRYSREASQKFTCTAPGFYAFPTGDVSQYYQCVMIKGVWYSYVYKCPPNSGFVTEKGLCVVGATTASKTPEASKKPAA